MPDDLSEECKQKLRSIDRDLAGVRDRLLVMRETVVWSLQIQSELYGYGVAVDAASTALSGIDEPCRRVLRGIDQSVLSVTGQLRRPPRDQPRGDSFEDQAFAQDLLQQVEDLQFAIQNVFFEGV